MTQPLRPQVGEYCVEEDLLLLASQQAGTKLAQNAEVKARIGKLQSQSILGSQYARGLHPPLADPRGPREIERR